MTTTPAQADRDLQFASELAPPVRQSLYGQMVLNRVFETETKLQNKADRIGGDCHLSSAQQVTAAGVVRALEDDDLLVVGYRCHGFALTRGVHGAVVAEIEASVSAGVRSGGRPALVLSHTTDKNGVTAPPVTRRVGRAQNAHTVLSSSPRSRLLEQGTSHQPGGCMSSKSQRAAGVLGPHRFAVLSAEVYARVVSDPHVVMGRLTAAQNAQALAPGADYHALTSGSTLGHPIERTVSTSLYLKL
jgi:hypothetical protein